MVVRCLKIAKKGEKTAKFSLFPRKFNFTRDGTDKVISKPVGNHSIGFKLSFGPLCL